MYYWQLLVGPSAREDTLQAHNGSHPLGRHPHHAQPNLLRWGQLWCWRPTREAGVCGPLCAPSCAGGARTAPLWRAWLVPSHLAARGA